MKILCLRAYYDPEQTAGTHLMNDLEECIISKHEIEYIVSTPTRGVSEEIRKEYKHRKYEKKFGGKVTVKRFSMFKEGKSPVLRAFRYLCCNCAQLFYGSRVLDTDVILSGSTPPTIGVTCVLLSKRLTKRKHRKVPIIYKIDDIFPDSLVQAGLTKKGSLLWRIGRILENYIYRNAKVLIVNSAGMKRNIVKKGVTAAKVKVINNWIDFNAVQPVSKELNPLYDELNIPRDKYIVLYAGNFGEAQGAEIIEDVARELRDMEDLIFVVFGGGTRFSDFREKVSGTSNIYTFDLQPLEKIAEVYSLADLSLITCKPGFGRIGLPSKTWSIMACNKKIIASFDTRSDLASVVAKCKAGIVVPPGDAGALAEAIADSLASYKDTGDSEMEIRKNAMKIASKEFCTGEYLKILETILE